MPHEIRPFPCDQVNIQMGDLIMEYDVNLYMLREGEKGLRLHHTCMVSLYCINQAVQ